MKSPIFTRLIQGMDQFDDELCKSEEAQLRFIEAYVTSLKILKSYAHTILKTMTLDELQNYHLTMAKRHVEYIGKSLAILDGVPIESLHLDTHKITKEDVTWAIATLRTKQ